MNSLIIPVFKNEDNLPDLLDALRELNRDLDDTLEVVFVVDGSPDACFMELEKTLPNEDFASQLILHSRNFGSFAAIRTGLQSAKGDRFAVMAADLQEPLELISEFFRVVEADEADVVFGVRDSRSDPLISKILSEVYWSLYRRFVFPDVPKGGVDVFGCSMQFKQELMQLGESHTSLIGLIFWLGFRRKAIAYERRRRRHGKSAWTFRKKLNYLLDSLFAFSDLPIKLLALFGLLGILIAVALSIVTLMYRFSGYYIPGYTTSVITILFFGGLNAFGLGVIGSYIWRAYGNSQSRPNAVVMKHARFPE